MELKPTIQTLETKVSSSNTFWKAATIIALLLMITFGSYSLVQERKINKLQSDIVTRDYSQFQPFIEKRTKDSSIIVEQTQLIAHKDAQIVKQIEKIEKLKSLSAQVVYNTNIIIDSVKIPYLDSAKVITKIDTTSKDTLEYIQVPLLAQVINKNYQIDETVLSTGIELNHLMIPDSTTITIGDKGNLFKNKPVVLITHSNPYIKTLDLKNIVVESKISKATKTFFIGAGIGFSLEALLTGVLYIATHH